MFFFIKYPHSRSIPVTVVHLEARKRPENPVAGTLYIDPGVQSLETLDLPGGKLLLLGDPVFDDKKTAAKAIIPSGKFEEGAIFENIRGHFYWFHIHLGGLRCGTSFGAIFPVYYGWKDGHIHISSSSFFLADMLDIPPENRRNLLERLLFNYPVFDSTWWQGLHLLDAHRYLSLTGTAADVAGSFNLYDCFGKVEMNGRESLARLASVFGVEADLYFPEERFAVSMTGGFDGRTLAAAALGRDFFTYSFGRPDSSDVTLPAQQASKLGLNHFSILLDENYVKQEALPAARSFMKLTEFNGNYGRPHYEYAAGRLAEKTRYILTGNFGSELFRALHQPGEMMSECLVRVFAITDDSWKDFLKKVTISWDSVFFKNELDALIADLEIYRENMLQREPNHRFYHFVFSEMFRKYFGPELVMQSHYLRNRTPYLDLRFFRELNRTPWAGVHSRLFEKYKGKRMKGQMFYASFLRQVSPLLFHLPTNKGYSPADVLQRWRLPLLVGKVACRRYLHAEETDSHSVGAFFRAFHGRLREGILQDGAVPFFQEQFHRSLPDITAGRDFQKWIKFYSIANGWQKAKRGVSKPSFNTIH